MTPITTRFCPHCDSTGEWHHGDNHDVCRTCRGEGWFYVRGEEGVEIFDSHDDEAAIEVYALKKVLRLAERYPDTWQYHADGLVIDAFYSRAEAEWFTVTLGATVVRFDPVLLSKPDGNTWVWTWIGRVESCAGVRKRHYQKRQQ